MSFYFNLLYNQLFIKPPYPSHDFTGQTVIITGSNAGLGLEAARHITRLQASKVILAVRNLEKGEQAKASIEKSTGRQGVVHVWSLDLSSYDSVKDFVKKAQGLSRLDVMLENAGVATKIYRKAEEDETTITVNVVSTFLLALMIIPKLRETAMKYNVTPHLVIVSSDAHAHAKFPEKNSPIIFDTLNERATTDPASIYMVSKLLEIFYCRMLAAHLRDSNKPIITLNFPSPGFCESELLREAGWGVSIAKIFLARTTEVGSRTLVASACADHESHGQYMDTAQVTKPSPFVLSKEGLKTQKRVWDELNAKLEKIQPGILADI